MVKSNILVMVTSVDYVIKCSGLELRKQIQSDNTSWEGLKEETIHPLRRPEIRQISSEIYVLSKPGISVRLYLDSGDLDSMQRQISDLKKKD